MKMLLCFMSLSGIKLNMIKKNFSESASGVMTYVFTADNAGPNIVDPVHILLTGGVHGSEPYPAEALEEVTEALFAGHMEVSGLASLISMPECNYPALTWGNRFIMRDVNRHVGDPDIGDKYIEAEIARYITAQIDELAGKEGRRIYADFHSSAAPQDFVFTDDIRTREDIHSLAVATGTSFIVDGYPVARYNITGKKSNTTRGYSHGKDGVTAILAECGENDDPDTKERALTRIIGTINHVATITDPGPFEKYMNPDVSNQVIVRVTTGAERQDCGQEFAVDDLKNLDFLEKGTKVVKYGDGSSWSMPWDGYVVLPNIKQPILLMAGRKMSM